MMTKLRAFRRHEHCEARAIDLQLSRGEIERSVIAFRHAPEMAIHAAFGQSVFSRKRNGMYYLASLGRPFPIDIVCIPFRLSRTRVIASHNIGEVTFFRLWRASGNAPILSEEPSLYRGKE